MSRGRGVRGRALRAICPECKRDTACYADRLAIEAGAGLSYLLVPHNFADTRHPCRGWRVGKADLVSQDSKTGDSHG